ncbi:YraN family protein [Cohnella caldifontis]|uniref:YraN family protein n=1 Tax=Cohnella caldifontis TaxID=3027471 RepID=UPI0023EDC395|nr:YraN family protein [Cohnella sp. YIM B05605]
MTSSRSNRISTGRAAEEAAAAYFEEKGCTVAARNWRCRTGELDLIVREGTSLVFVEVRSRTAPTRYGTAVEAVTPRKCRQVRQTAEVYLKMNGLEGHPTRFDAVAVTFGPEGSVRELKHIPGAF